MDVRVGLWRIDAFDLRCWRKLLRVPWTARRSKQWILKEINPEYSMQGLMLELKLQYFGLLMQRTDSLEKTLILGKIEGKWRRGWHRNSWLDDITNSMHWVWASSGRWWRTGESGVLPSRGRKELDMTERLNSNNYKEEFSRLHLCVSSIIYSYQDRVLFSIFYEVSIMLLFLFLKLVQF